MAFFGSVLREDFNSDSDIDVLVEFEPDHVPGLAVFTIQEKLAQLLGRQVDLNTPNFLGPNLHPVIETEALIQYVQE